MSPPQSPQNVEMVLSFLGSGTVVKDPGDVLNWVNTKDILVLFWFDNLQGGDVNVQWEVVPWCLVVFGWFFLNVQREVVDLQVVVSPICTVEAVIANVMSHHSHITFC